MWQDIIHTYSNFFSWSEFMEAFGHPAGLGLIVSLIILEGLLSADNALVLAAMVRHLPEHQRKKALMLGLWGAYLFRFIAIGFGVYLVKIAWVKYAGAAYLLWIAIKHFIDKAKDKNEDGDGVPESKSTRGFWATVVMVELMDITFSVDSVLAAFGVSNHVWVLFAGGILGILMMRLVAQLFLKLLDKVPELETGAFVIIAIIGVKMILATAGVYEMSHAIFFGVLIAVFLGAFVANKVRQPKMA